MTARSRAYVVIVETCRMEIRQASSGSSRVCKSNCDIIGWNSRLQLREINNFTQCCFIPLLVTPPLLSHFISLYVISNSCRLFILPSAIQQSYHAYSNVPDRLLNTPHSLRASFSFWNFFFFRLTFRVNFFFLLWHFLTSWLEWNKKQSWTILI